MQIAEAEEARAKTPKKAMISNSPFIAYKGDWSINNFINQVKLRMKAASMVVSVIDGGESFGFNFQAVDQVMGYLDKAIDWINFLPPEGNLINKDQKYAIYQPVVPSLSSLLFLSPYHVSHPTESIRNLHPIQPGNSWDSTETRLVFTCCIIQMLEE